MDRRQCMLSSGTAVGAMDHGAYIDAAAHTLGLSLTQEQREGVALYFGLAASMAELVNGLPLTAADESGNIFVPVPPMRPEGSE